MGRTATWGCIVTAALHVACHGHQTELVAEQVTVRYCATSVQVRDIERCVAEIPVEQQRRRAKTTRLTYRGAVLQKRELISGSGELMDADVESYEYSGGRIVRVANTSANGVPVGYETFSPDGVFSHNFDERGRPKTYPEPNASGTKRQFDAAGFVQSLTYVGVAGDPAPVGPLYELRTKRNAQGVAIEWTAFGTKGEPVRGPSGSHRVVDEVDGVGLTHDQKCFDEESRPTLCHGAHEVRSRYDDAGNYIQLEFFGIDGRAARDERWGAVSVRITRDERGNSIETRLFDEHGQLTLGTNGYASIKVSYDARDRPLERAYFGVDGKPIKLASGAATLRYTYDAHGNELTVLGFDDYGARVMSSDGYFRLDTEWDARDNPLTTRYSDLAGLPVRTKRGYATEKRLYDGDRLVGYGLFDVADKPTAGRDGYARAELSYDVDGKRDTWRYFDVDGKSVGYEHTNCQGSVGEPLKREIDARRGAFRTCYEALLQTGHRGRGKVAVRFQVDAQAQVTFAAISDDQIGSDSLDQCLLQKFRQPFARGADHGCANINVPVSFTSK
jgi:hypothetical protein